MLNTPWPELRIAGTIPESITDGPGFRYVIFTQGCPHHCPGCHNPQTHPFEGGEVADVEKILAEIAEDPLLAGVTLSGGEPFCQAAALLPIARAVKAMGKTVMAYSGWTYTQLRNLAEKDDAVAELLALCDILVDGPFIEAERDLTLLYRGSRNQRVLELNQGHIVREIK
ncbi:MAG: anaerobic ribonucleoside-triphosphate reductase activating protein [Firmicutes bacterium]|nr:anaerobic ribonucleoside-triphosphate reductase activating protein [Bacillota bacterium]